ISIVASIVSPQIATEMGRLPERQASKSHVISSITTGQSDQIAAIDQHAGRNRLTCSAAQDELEVDRGDSGAGAEERHVLAREPYPSRNVAASSNAAP